MIGVKFVLFLTIIALRVFTLSGRGLCSEGWQRWSEFCYKLIPLTGVSSYNDTRLACQREGADFPLVEDYTVNDFMASMLSRNSAPSTLLGVYLVLGTKYLWPGEIELDFKKWLSNSSSIEETLAARPTLSNFDCVDLLPTKQWRLTVCTAVQEFVICRKDILSGLICGEKVTWT